MPDYSKGVIYTIRVGDKVYVGSTCAYPNRKYEHKCRIYDESRREYKSKLYSTIRENNGEWDMKPYKQFPCNNKTELVIEEERVRRELNADLNSYKCDFIVDKEKYKKDYYQDNIKKYKETREKNKEWFKNIFECECGCEIKRGGLAKHIKTQKHIKLMENKLK